MPELNTIDFIKLVTTEEPEKFCNTCIIEKRCIALRGMNKLVEGTEYPAFNDNWGCTKHTTQKMIDAEQELAQIQQVQ